MVECRAEQCDRPAVRAGWCRQHLEWQAASGWALKRALFVASLISVGIGLASLLYPISYSDWSGRRIRCGSVLFPDDDAPQTCFDDKYPFWARLSVVALAVAVVLVVMAFRRKVDNSHQVRDER